VSTIVGPAGSTRFSTRRCGLPRATRRSAGSSGRSVPLCSTSSAGGGRRRGSSTVLRVLVVEQRAAAPGSSARSRRTGRARRRSSAPRTTPGAGPPGRSAPRSGCRWSARTGRCGSRASSSLPSRNGEFAPTATCAAAMAWAAFQAPANPSGLTCRCSCTEVAAASIAIEEATATAAPPLDLEHRSSPRASRICSLSRW
jgi:hypothetical protein